MTIVASEHGLLYTRQSAKKKEQNVGSICEIVRSGRLFRNFFALHTPASLTYVAIIMFQDERERKSEARGASQPLANSLVCRQSKVWVTYTLVNNMLYSFDNDIAKFKYLTCKKRKNYFSIK